VKASAINYLVDAGPLVGLLDADDQWHDWSDRTLTVLDEPLASTETALAEACHHLRDHRPALQELMLMLAEGRLRLAPILSVHPRRVGELLEKYPRMDAGDATRARLITVDSRDFGIYRRRDGRAVPSIIPPQ